MFVKKVLKLLKLFVSAAVKCGCIKFTQSNNVLRTVDIIGIHSIASFEDDPHRTWNLCLID